MDPTIIFGVSGLIVTMGGWVFTYGKLHAEVKALASKQKEDKGDIERRLADRAALQDERDRRQDARTKTVEAKLDAHTTSLADVRETLAGIAKDMQHVVKAVDKLADE